MKGEKAGGYLCNQGVGEGLLKSKSKNSKAKANNQQQQQQELDYMKTEMGAVWFPDLDPGCT